MGYKIVEGYEQTEKPLETAEVKEWTPKLARDLSSRVDH